MSAPAMQFLSSIDVQALDECLTSWLARHPRMGVLALLPEAEQAAVPLIQQVCAARSVPLVGAVFPALVVRGEFCTHGVWLLRFDVMPHAALYARLPQDREQASQVIDDIVAGLKPHLQHGDDDITLFMVFDSMVPNIATLLDELYLRLANRVHYMGANAGSETFKPMPCLFDERRIVEGGVLVMLLAQHQGALLDHGYGVPPHMITATSTEGNRILQIDWRPAFEVYQELARSQYNVAVDRENFYQYAVHFPFGIVRANGIILVRIPVALEDDGSLFCVGEVPPNSMLTLLQAPVIDSSHTIERLVRGMTELNGNLSGREMLLFYCAGRRLHLGVESANSEVKALERRSGVRHVAGALSLGEIGSTTQWGYPLFHNATMLVSCWNERDE